MDTNFWGPMRTVRAVLPGMREQGSGVIINVSSLASRLPAALYSGMYAASKQALNEAAPLSLTPGNITVHASPGQHQCRSGRPDNDER
jgi:short-subunit dehydrogenase